MFATEGLLIFMSYLPKLKLARGSEYKLFFIGEKKFAGQNDTLVFQSEPNVAEVKIREGILDIMKNGLLKYMLQTNLKVKSNILLI